MAKKSEAQLSEIADLILEGEITCKEAKTLLQEGNFYSKKTKETPEKKQEIKIKKDSCQFTYRIDGEIKVYLNFLIHYPYDAPYLRILEMVSFEKEKGYQTKLFGELSKFARLKRISFLEAEVDLENKNARTFLERRGFESFTPLNTISQNEDRILYFQKVG